MSYEKIVDKVYQESRMYYYEVSFDFSGVLFSEAHNGVENES